MVKGLEIQPSSKKQKKHRLLFDANGERFARRKQAFAPGRDLRPFGRKGESVNPRKALGFEQRQNRRFCASDCLFAVCNHDNDNPEDGIDLNALDDVSKGYRQQCSK